MFWFEKTRPQLVVDRLGPDAPNIYLDLTITGMRAARGGGAYVQMRSQGSEFSDRDFEFFVTGAELNRFPVGERIRFQLIDRK